MTVYIVLALITCSLTLLLDREAAVDESIIENGTLTRSFYKNKIIYYAIFFILFVISAGRIAIGGDYWSYTAIFNLLAQNRDGAVATEVGFNLLVKIVQHLFGYDGKQYIIIFAIVAFFTILFFIKGFKNLSENFPLTFFLFMMLGYYLSSFDSIRNYLTFAMALFAVKYLFKKQYWKFVMLALIGSFFHISILLILVAYPLGKIKWKPWFITVLSAATLSLLFLKPLYRKLVFLIYPQYEGTIYDNADVSYVNIARCLGVLVLSVILFKKVIKGNEKNLFFFKMNIFATIVYCFCSFLPIVSRVGYYFNIFQLILVPHLIKGLPKKWMRITATGLTVLGGICYYLYFLYSNTGKGIFIVPYMNWVMH